MQRFDLSTVRDWLQRCLGVQAVSLESAREMGKGSDCLVWDCVVAGKPLVLKVYALGFDDYSNLGPVDTARKHALALIELSRLGVPTPQHLGFTFRDDEAGLVMERVTGQRWTPTTRRHAAELLARLHLGQVTDLSEELAALVSRSTPNRGRIGDVSGEPPIRQMTLQHGDYFSVNIAATQDGLRVLDWDLFALGDPMWDLGFLLCADRGVTEAEAGKVIAAYHETRPVDPDRLGWQRACWRTFWQRRDADA